MWKSNIIVSLFQFSYGSWVQALLSIFALPIFAFYLSPAEYAVISIFTIVYSFGISFVFLGLDQAFVRFYPFDTKNDNYVSDFYSISEKLFVIAAVLITLLSNNISEYILGFKDWKIVLLLIIHIYSGMILRYATLTLRCENESIHYSNSQIYQSLVYFVLGLALVQLEFRAFSLVISFVSAQVFTTIYVVIIAKKKVGFKLCFLSKLKLISKEIYLYSLPFIPILGLDWLLLNFDKIVLRSSSTLETMGIYFAAFKIVFALNVVQLGFKAFWTPYAIKHMDNNDSKELFNSISKWLVFVFSFIFIVLVLLRNVIVHILPESYGEIAQIFPLLLLGPVLSTLYDLCTININYANKPGYHIVSYLGALLVGLPLAFYVVPNWGIIGAVFSYVIVNLIYFLTGYYLSNKIDTDYYAKGMIIFNIAMFLSIGISAYTNNVNSLLLLVLILLGGNGVYMKEDFKVIVQNIVEFVRK